MLRLSAGYSLIGRIARYTAAMVLLLIIAVGLRLFRPHDLDTVASTKILAYLAVLCLLVPPRAGLPCFLGVLGGIGAIEWVNDEKIALTRESLATPLGLYIGAQGDNYNQRYDSQHPPLPEDIHRSTKSFPNIVLVFAESK